MKVVWSAEATRSLRQIVSYIAQDSPMTARKVTARLLLRSRQLGEPPLLGRRLPEYPGQDLRELLERSWWISGYAGGHRDRDGAALPAVAAGHPDPLL